MNLMNAHLNKYGVPKNLNSNWNLGFILGCLFICQVLSGLLLVLFYTPMKDGAFLSIRYVSVEPNFGWYIHCYHSIGVSGYFLAMYCHMIKGMWFSSRYLPWSWFTGILIFILSIGIAFIGYVLPDGQMSYWGATVIKNLLEWLGRGNTLIFGGYTICPATLQRFFLLHFVLPFIIFAILVGHIYVLHRNSSSNPLLQSEAYVSERFYPTAFFSDVKLFLVLGLLIGIQISYGVIGMFQADHDNSVIADMMKTPVHIIPEWYLLLYYSSLKMFTSKIGGFMAMAFILEAMVILVEARAVSPVIASIHYHRSWTYANISVLPMLFMLGFMGKMAINLCLAFIGINSLLLVCCAISKMLDSSRVRG